MNALENCEKFEQISRALEESVKLQAHYAKLLNVYDGGKRIIFSTKEWLARCSGQTSKTLDNANVVAAKSKIPDLKVVGDGDMFKLLCKASSQNEGWMKSTKAMEIDKLGCVVQVTTQQRNPDGSYSVAEAVTFVPEAKIVEEPGNGCCLRKSECKLSKDAAESEIMAKIIELPVDVRARCLMAIVQNVYRQARSLGSLSVEEIELIIEMAL